MTTGVAESHASFPCFGGRVTIVAATGQRELILLRVLLEDWHRRLTRFDPASELSRLNHDPRKQVPVSPIMACFVAAAIEAADRTDGLVDPTLVEAIEAAGYAGDPATRTVARPPGVMLDSGGVAKGLFADLIAMRLSDVASFAVDCCGDVAIGGSAAIDRPVLVDDPFGRGAPLHEFRIARGGVATSGIGRRSWIRPDGLRAHHLLDPSTGRPAYTGVVQATALAPTAVDAEARAKAALLSADPRWLGEHGGVLVFDDGSHMVAEQP
jgi:thiamine biosynthesis lipoprotein